MLDSKLLPFYDYYVLSFEQFRGVCIVYNCEEIARVCIKVKVWLERNLGQSEGGGMGRGVFEQKNNLRRATAPSGGLQ